MKKRYIFLIISLVLFVVTIMKFPVRASEEFIFPCYLEIDGRQYKHEMTDSDHELLLDALLKHRGPVILSGYDSPMYSDALRHWNKECIVSRNQACRETNEILWMNY